MKEWHGLGAARRETMPSGRPELQLGWVITQPNPSHGEQVGSGPMFQYESHFLFLYSS
jgi:hypothetical protein